MGYPPAMKHPVFGPLFWAFLLSTPALVLYGPGAALLAVLLLLPVCFAGALLARLLSPRA